MSIFSIFLWSMGVFFAVFCLYAVSRIIYDGIRHWEEKLTQTKKREEELEKKRINFLGECDKHNNMVWQEKNKTIEQYKAALNAISLSEEMRSNTQNELEKLRTKVKELEKQLHHSRQRRIRISDKSRDGKKQQNEV